MKTEEIYVSYNSDSIAQAYSRYLETQRSFELAKKELKEKFFRSDSEWKHPEQEYFEYNFVVIDATENEVAFEIGVEAIKGKEELDVYEPRVNMEEYTIDKDSILIFIN